MGFSLGVRAELWLSKVVDGFSKLSGLVTDRDGDLQGQCWGENLSASRTGVPKFLPKPTSRAWGGFTQPGLEGEGADPHLSSSEPL